MLQELGLPVDPSVPLLAFIGRLDEQKGVILVPLDGGVDQMYRFCRVDPLGHH